MSETGNSDKGVTAAPPKATLHLKRPVEQGTVRQSFSHGRSKAVVVEKVKRRILTPGEAAGGGGGRRRAGGPRGPPQGGGAGAGRAPPPPRPPSRPLRRRPRPASSCRH